METRPEQRGIPVHSNANEGGARRPTSRPEQVQRIQNISRGPPKRKNRDRQVTDEEDDFQDFS
tara:strand:- start:212 stop:400 length:189 start_codon:yes stop_codon:yes gene_type:complete